MLTMRDVEDIAIIRNMQAVRAASEEIREMNEDIAFAREMRLALQDKNAQINKLRAELTAAANGCTARNEIIRADQMVRKHFVAEYAKATGKSEAEVKDFAAKLRRKSFDHCIEEGLKNGSLSEDPRKTGEIAGWYSALP